MFIVHTDADCVGVGIDYTNAMGNSSNFFQRDYDLITRSGVASGNTNLPESRKSKAETQGALFFFTLWMFA